MRLKYKIYTVTWPLFSLLKLSLWLIHLGFNVYIDEPKMLRVNFKRLTLLIFY